MIWHTHPFVSCLLVLADSTRIRLAEQAIECFQQQTWPLKELVVINSTGHRFAVPTHDLLPQCVSTLEQRAVESAKGEWCLNWRDDCWFASNYIHKLMGLSQKHSRVQASPIRVYSVSQDRYYAADVPGLCSWFRLGCSTETVCQRADDFVLKFVL